MPTLNFQAVEKVFICWTLLLQLPIRLFSDNRLQTMVTARVPNGTGSFAIQTAKHLERE
ncbi:MAG: hypothetical protein IPP86_02485 [Bacteroidetes bacterium]|nr:hypothetical protein [Bacteroidota bacterium]